LSYPTTQLNFGRGKDVRKRIERNRTGNENEKEVKKLRKEN